jgi:hypothetical protein
MVNKATNAVGIIAPSPLAGEGSAILPRATTGEGCDARTPHPFEFVGRPLCPLPQGERAREGRTAYFGGANPPNPTRVVRARGTPRRLRRGDPVAGTHDHRQWLWAPALAALGRDDDLSYERRTNLRLWETVTGCDPLFPDCYLQ